ncbi:hypothetical protein [Nonomuraea sp. NPDC002799]
MSKAVERRERAPGSWVWRAVRITAIVVLVVSLLIWFLVDPFDLPGDLLEGLNQRASVIGMFTGAGGLIVAILGLRVQKRSQPIDDIVSTTGSPGPGQAEPAHARGPRHRRVLLIAAVPTVVVALIVLAVVWNAPVRYEAEDAYAHNKAEIIHIGGTSNNAVMGHINFPESWVEIRVYASRAGTHTVNLRYRVGDGDARQSLTVNGGAKRLVDYPDHDDDHKWSNWSDLSIKLTLNHGWNKLRFQHDGGLFAAELDFVEIA